MKSLVQATFIIIIIIIIITFCGYEFKSNQKQEFVSIVTSMLRIYSFSIPPPPPPPPPDTHTQRKRNYSAHVSFLYFFICPKLKALDE